MKHIIFFYLLLFPLWELKQEKMLFKCTLIRVSTECLNKTWKSHSFLRSIMYLHNKTTNCRAHFNMCRAKHTQRCKTQEDTHLVKRGLFEGLWSPFHHGMKRLEHSKHALDVALTKVQTWRLLKALVPHLVPQDRHSDKLLAHLDEEKRRWKGRPALWQRLSVGLGIKYHMMTFHFLDSTELTVLHFIHSSHSVRAQYFGTHF